MILIKPHDNIAYPCKILVSKWLLDVRTFASKMPLRKHSRLVFIFSVQYQIGLTLTLLIWHKVLKSCEVLLKRNKKFLMRKSKPKANFKINLTVSARANLRTFRYCSKAFF